jgi:hypothetical protein
MVQKQFNSYKFLFEIKAKGFIDNFIVDYNTTRNNPKPKIFLAFLASYSSSFENGI